MKENYSDNFQELITRGEEILRTRISRDGGTRRISSQINSIRDKVDMVDPVVATAWATECATLIGATLGPQSDYKKRIDETILSLKSKRNFHSVRAIVELMKSAKGYLERGNPFAIFSEQEYYTKLEDGIELEARKNTRIYLVVLGLLFASLVVGIWLQFGWEWAAASGSVIIVLGYIGGAISLKEITPGKLPERFLEWELARLQRRFLLQQSEQLRRQSGN